VSFENVCLENHFAYSIPTSIPFQFPVSHKTNNMVQSDGDSSEVVCPNPLEGQLRQTKFPLVLVLGISSSSSYRDHRRSTKHHSNKRPNLPWLFNVLWFGYSSVSNGFKLARTLTMPPGPEGGRRCTQGNLYRTTARRVINLFGLRGPFNSSCHLSFQM
jgi:hypothetical protein